MDQYAYKEVKYFKYCPSCKYRKKSNIEDPCNECLDEPINLNSHKPTMYEEGQKARVEKDE